METNPLLDWLLEGVGVDTFFTEYWGKQPLYLKRGADYYDGLISGKELLDATFAGNVPYPLLDLRRNGKNVWDDVLLPDKSYNQTALRRYLDEGLTFHYRRVEDFTALKPLVEAISEHIGKQYTYVSAWLAPAPSKHWIHYDALEALVLQIEGEKVWRLYESYDLGTKIFYNDSPNRGDVIAEFTLTAGDLLYVPRGMYHSAQAESHSLHLVIPHDGLTTGELVLALAREMMEHNAAYWENLPLDWRTSKELPALVSNLLSKIESQLPELRQCVTPVTSFIDPLPEQGYTG